MLADVTERSAYDMADLIAQQPIVYINLPEDPERHPLFLRAAFSLVKSQQPTGDGHQ